MKIAVACDGLSIASHFIQCSSYMCYTVVGDIVVDSHNMPALDQPLEKLPEFFDAIEVDALMTGKIEDELAANLRAHGLIVVPGVSGDPLTAVRAYLAENSKVLVN